MFTKTILGFAITASVRASRGNYSALNTSDTFDHQNGTQPAAFNVPDGIELIRLNSDTTITEISFGKYETVIRALWFPSSVEFSPTVLMLNDNSVLSSRATTPQEYSDEYPDRLKEYKQQAVDVRNKFQVNVLMVIYRGNGSPPSHYSMYLDAVAAYEYLTNRYLTKRSGSVGIPYISVFGNGYGAYAAAQLASNYPDISGIVLSHTEEGFRHNMKNDRKLTDIRVLMIFKDDEVSNKGTKEYFEFAGEKRKIDHQMIFVEKEDAIVPINPEDVKIMRTFLYKEDEMPPGMEFINHKRNKNCDMNVIFQALAYVPSVREYSENHYEQLSPESATGKVVALFRGVYTGKYIEMFMGKIVNDFETSDPFTFLETELYNKLDEEFFKGFFFVKLAEGKEEEITRIDGLQPLTGNDYPKNPMAGSTVVIRPPYDENENPTPIDFNINENLGGKWYRLTGIVMKRGYHYTTIAYVPEKGRWYNFNDEQVLPIFGYPHPENLGDPNNVPVLFLYTLESGPLTPKQELEDMERAFYARYPTPQEQESDEAKKEMESILSHKLQVLEHELNFISEEKNIILQKQNDIKIREEKGDFQLEIEKIFLEQQKKFLEYLDKKFSNMLKKCKEQYENDRDMHQSKKKNNNGN